VILYPSDSESIYKQQDQWQSSKRQLSTGYWVCNQRLKCSDGSNGRNNDPMGTRHRENGRETRCGRRHWSKPQHQPSDDDCGAKGENRFTATARLQPMDERKHPFHDIHGNQGGANDTEEAPPLDTCRQSPMDSLSPPRHVRSH